MHKLLEDQEIQLKDLVSENQRVTALALERLKQLEEWKRKFNDLEEKYKIETGELKAQIELYKSNQYVKLIKHFVWGSNMYLVWKS